MPNPIELFCAFMTLSVACNALAPLVLPDYSPEGSGFPKVAPAFAAATAYMEAAVMERHAPVVGSATRQTTFASTAYHSAIDLRRLIRCLPSWDRKAVPCKELQCPFLILCDSV